jgi:hypothetical protein
MEDANLNANNHDQEGVCYRQGHRTLRASKRPLFFLGSEMRHSGTWLYIKGMLHVSMHAVTSINGVTTLTVVPTPKIHSPAQL